MRIVLVTGGARSGKSRWAVERARSLAGEAVSFVATGRVTDEEMARRIERHRAERPAGWETLEAATDPAGAVREARHDVVLLDCLTFVVAGATAVEHGTVEEDALERARRRVEEILVAADDRKGDLLVVTNEVGMGVVPATPLGRWFRDAQGWANQRVAGAAEEVVLLVSGIPTWVKGRGRG